MRWWGLVRLRCGCGPCLRWRLRPRRRWLPFVVVRGLSWAWAWSFIVSCSCSWSWFYAPTSLKEGRGGGGDDVAWGLRPRHWGGVVSRSRIRPRWRPCGCRGASERERAGGDVAAGSGVDTHLGNGPSPVFGYLVPVVRRGRPWSLASLWLSVPSDPVLCCRRCRGFMRPHPSRRGGATGEVVGRGLAPSLSGRCSWASRRAPLSWCVVVVSESWSSWFYAPTSL